MKNKLASEYILETSREYSIYTCENRAIPKASDGLKDGQRKALWLMKTRGEKIKTVSLAGEMISSNLYVHGDASAADTISKLTAPYLNNVPLFEGIGTFGTRIAPVDGIGAPRYTYVKRGKAADAFLYKDLDIVPLKENYDGSTMEPITFLPIIPTVLLNGVSGIAVGWSTEILPRSLNDLIDATVAAIDGKPVKKLVPTYQYLDVGVSNLEGNTWEFTGKVEIIDSSTVKICELPIDLSLEKFRDRLDTMEEDGKINDYVDNSTETIDIVVKFKRGVIAKWTEQMLIEYFKLKSKKTERIVVVDWSGAAIRQYETAEQVVKDFVDWRFQHYIKRYEKLLEDDSYELKFWKGVKACFDGKLPAALPAAKNKEEVSGLVGLMTEKIGLDDKQVDKIINLASYKWAKDNYDTVKETIKNLEENVKSYKDHLKNPDKIKAVFRDEVLALKKLKL